MSILSTRTLLAWSALLLLAHAVAAQVTTERGASIVVFPKVIADTSADTALQLVNLSDNHIDAFCTYVDGGDAPSTLSFTVTLGPLQPISWNASRGRTPTSEDPTAIPVPPAFRGELVCVESLAGAPFNGNQIAGQATVIDLASGDAAAYSAAALRGSALTDSDDMLCIGEAAPDCILGAEYDACPAEWILSLPAEGSSDPQRPDASLSSRVAIAPCSGNLRDGVAAPVDIDITVTNELGQQLSATVSVIGWSELALSAVNGGIFDRNVIGGDRLEARMAPSGASGGFMIVAETTRRTASPSAASTSALVPHARGTASNPDVLVIPTEAMP